MGTLRRILIKNLEKEIVIRLIQNHYSIGRIQTHDYEYREVFLDQMNYSFIVFDTFLNGWTELTVDFYNAVNEHDALLKKISLIFQTTVIFGYEQTTTGDARLVIWENGEIIRSIYQKSDLDKGTIIMKEDVGKRFSSESTFDYPVIGDNCSGYKILDFDDIQKLFQDAGYVGEKRKIDPKEYIHLEYLKQKRITQN